MKRRQFIRSIVFNGILVGTVGVSGADRLRGKRRRRRTSPRAIVQPNYQSWRRIHLGMSKSQVQSVLGDPIMTKESVIRLDRVFETSDWIYGWIDLRSRLVPGRFYFTVRFDGDKCSHIETPFSQLSSDGRPSTPSSLLPNEDKSFRHYPRFLDLRWDPSSGVYPMTYDVEVEFWGGTSFARYFSASSDITHTTAVHPGKSAGRWRVRGKNRLGVGAWSKYATFEFLV